MSIQAFQTPPHSPNISPHSPTLPSPEITLLLHNLRSLHNLGSILRTADGFGVHQVLLSGYTPLAGPHLPHVAAKLRAALAKTALGAEKTVPILPLGPDPQNLYATLHYIKSNSYIIIGLENNIPEKIIPLPVLKSILCTQFTPPSSNISSPTSLNTSPSTSPNTPSPTPIIPASTANTPPLKTPPKILLIPGSEVTGIPAELYPHIDHFTEIPMHGTKESFNVAVAVAITLYALLLA